MIFLNNFYLVNKICKLKIENGIKKICCEMELCFEDSDEMRDVMWKIWYEHRSFMIPAGYYLNGWSKSTVSSGFMIKSLKMMFDCGLRAPCPIYYTFLTHRHSDHSQCLRLRTAYEKQYIFVPEEDLENVTNVVLSGKKLQQGSDFDLTKLNYVITGVKEGFTQDIVVEGTKFKLRVFKCFHSVPCVGYGLSKEKPKLKLEYKDYQGKELKKLKEEGVEIS